MKLSDIPAGQAVQIMSLQRLEPHLRKRLLSLGFVPHSTIEVKRFAPLGDPIQVKVKGAQVAIRRSTAAQIEVSA